MPTSGHKAQRTCLGCRETVAQDALVRYVRSPAGEVLIDYGHKLPGRGAYTHFDSRCLQAAVKKRQFDRAFHGPSRAESEALSAALRNQVRERIGNLLGIARKSGQAVSGSNLVLAAIDTSTPPALILFTEDIAPGVAEKIQVRAARAGIQCHRLFDKEFLGQILGKGERSVAAFRESPLVASIRKELIRYEQIVGES